jgi:hypothetical protein
MRAMLLLIVVACSGCKTAEFALSYPTTGIQVVARFAAKDNELDGSIPMSDATPVGQERGPFSATTRTATSGTWRRF